MQALSGNYGQYLLTVTEKLMEPITITITITGWLFDYQLTIVHSIEILSNLYRKRS